MRKFEQQNDWLIRCRGRMRIESNYSIYLMNRMNSLINRNERQSNESITAVAIRNNEAKLVSLMNDQQIACARVRASSLTLCFIGNRRYRCNWTAFGSQFRQLVCFSLSQGKDCCKDRDSFNKLWPHRLFCQTCSLVSC